MQLGPEKGVMHLAVAAVINALWDLWAKLNNRPLWRLLTDMEPEVTFISTLPHVLILSIANFSFIFYWCCCCNCTITVIGVDHRFSLHNRCNYAGRSGRHAEGWPTREAATSGRAISHRIPVLYHPSRYVAALLAIFAGLWRFLSFGSTCF